MGNCQKSRQITNRHLLMNRYHSFCELSINRKAKFRLNDFNDETLMKIFSMLTLREKLSIIRVCKRWQRLIKHLLQKCVSVKLGEHSVKCSCNCDHYPNWDFPPHKYFERDDCGYIIYPSTLLNHLLRLCVNLKCINLSHCYIDNTALRIILHNSDQIECIHFYDIRLQEKPSIFDNFNKYAKNNHKHNPKKSDKFTPVGAGAAAASNGTDDSPEFTFYYLTQWKLLCKKLGLQLKYLSIGGLTALDQLAIDILLNYCNCLDELKINNEIDIISYLAIIRQTVKKIHIDCETGIGMDCISLLAFRNYAEKVESLGRVDVEPELIDSVISTIGSNFSNLKRLMLRVRSCDIDVSTPADFLFYQLEELSLQFVTGSVDVPFQKILGLGWTSIKTLTVQYASLTRESVAEIVRQLPQLEKLVLHAIEFRCDHSSKRYGHRLCIECERHCWKSLSRLSNLRHLKLHRIIIDDQICSALLTMTDLRSLDLHYCSNVNENIVDVCTQLSKRRHTDPFVLCIVSRGFLSFNKDELENKKLIIDVKVAC